MQEHKRQTPESYTKFKTKQMEHLHRRRQKIESSMDAFVPMLLLLIT